MTVEEAKDAIKKHFDGDVSNVKEFLDAIKIAEEDAGEMTLDELEKWGRE